MLSGSCLCGAVAYEVSAPIGPIVLCHCVTCRKAHGSAFASISTVPRAHFRWVRGEEFLAAFESSPGKFRRFCKRCGSHIVAERVGLPTLMLRLGCLDTPVNDKPKCHIWRSDGAPWYDPRDQLAELPRGFDAS